MKNIIQFLLRPIKIIYILIKFNIFILMIKENNFFIKLYNKIFKIKDKRETKIRKMLENLGPIFIKLGQTLSTRNDFFEEKIINELKKLQTNVKSVSFQKIKITVITTPTRRKLRLGGYYFSSRWIFFTDTDSFVSSLLFFFIPITY